MPGTITLGINQTVVVTTNCEDAYGAGASAKSNITYISSSPEIVTLATQGSFLAGTIPPNSISTNILSGVSNGNATVTVTVDGVVIDTISVVVNSNPVAALKFVFGTPTP